MSSLATALDASVASAHGLVSSAGAAPPALCVGTLTTRHRAIWERFVRAHERGTLFHTIAWLESVAEAFGHRPHHLLAWRGTQVEGVLPLFQINSLLGGIMLVSVPYAVGGGICADTAEASDALWQSAREIADRVGAGSIELRSEAAQVEEVAPVEGYVGFRRDLPASADDVLRWLPRKARAAARNAESKHGLTTTFGDDNLPAVWRLYCRSMRRLGSICYPYRFFETLLERHRADTYVQVVRGAGRLVGGLMSFRFGESFIPYFVGCDERFNRWGTNNFIYLTAMRRAVELGCTVFDFGRTRVDNRGSFDFKRFHGFEPRPLVYQRYVKEGCRGAELSPSNPRFALARKVWRHLPTPLCTRLGVWLARHIPG